MRIKLTSSEPLWYTRPVKKQRQQKHPSPTRQSGKASSETDMFVAIVPVKISIWHGETKMDEYEDEIAVEFTDDTTEGKKNIGQLFYLTADKGLSTEKAI